MGKPLMPSWGQADTAQLFGCFLLMANQFLIKGFYHFA